LNKGKRSIALNLQSAEGREVAQALVAAVGIFVTNFPDKGFLSHRSLLSSRPDLISVRVTGWSDGENAVDYTVNSALGIPMITGPAELDHRPVNHVVPGWDLLTGTYAAFALLAAERRRRLTGEGGEIVVPLGDVAIAAIGNLGFIGEAAQLGHDRPRFGNDVFGAFGRDFEAADGRRVMVVAITPHQWSALIAALELSNDIAKLEKERQVSFAADEGTRFLHKDALNELIGGAIRRLSKAELRTRFVAAGVTWGSYQSLSDALEHDPRFQDGNAMLSTVEHLSKVSYPTPGAPAVFRALPRSQPSRAPRLGEHSEEILTNVLGLSAGKIGDLVDRGIVGVPASQGEQSV
jgi:2-methylfumaryl-CoA isomerase